MLRGCSFLVPPRSSWFIPRKLTTTYLFLLLPPCEGKGRCSPSLPMAWVPYLHKQFPSPFLLRPEGSTAHLLRACLKNVITKAAIWFKTDTHPRRLCCYSSEAEFGCFLLTSGGDSVRSKVACSRLASCLLWGWRANKRPGTVAYLVAYVSHLSLRTTGENCVCKFNTAISIYLDKNGTETWPHS